MKGGYGIIDMNILVLCIKANRVRRWITQEKVYDYSDAKGLKYEKEAEFIKKGGLLNVEFIMCGEILDKWMEYKNSVRMSGRVFVV